MFSDLYDINQDTGMMLFSDGSQVYAIRDPVTASNSNGFKSVVLDLLGDYEAIVVEYAYENNNGYVTYVREIQPDYPWLIGAAIFAIVLYCTIRLGAKILCNR